MIERRIVKEGKINLTSDARDVYKRMQTNLSTDCDLLRPRFLVNVVEFCDKFDIGA